MGNEKSTTNYILKFRCGFWQHSTPLHLFYYAKVKQDQKKTDSCCAKPKGGTNAGVNVVVGLEDLIEWLQGCIAITKWIYHTTESAELPVE